MSQNLDHSINKAILFRVGHLSRLEHPKNNNPDKTSANNADSNNTDINADNNNPEIPVNCGYFVENDPTYVLETDVIEIDVAGDIVAVENLILRWLCSKYIEYFR